MRHHIVFLTSGGTLPQPGANDPRFWPLPAVHLQADVTLADGATKRLDVLAPTTGEATDQLLQLVPEQATHIQTRHLRRT